MDGQPDRVSYTYGFKLPGSEQYSSVNVSLSYSTDVLENEDANKAMDRARKLVQDQCERDLDDASKLRESEKDTDDDEWLEKKSKKV